MGYSDVIATIALVVSLATAGWAGWRTWRWDRPVLFVSGTQWIGGRSLEPATRIAGFSLEVVNTGNQSTLVIDAYWEIDRGNGVGIHFKASHGGGGVDSLFAAPPLATAPELPFALERYGRRAWDFELGLAGITDPTGILRARPAVQFTSRKKTELAYGLWQPSQIAIDASLPQKDRGL